MKKAKKILSVILAVIMILGAAPLAGISAFAADSDFTIVDGVLTAYNGKGGDVVIPDGVIAIEESAFKDCASLKSVTIPDSVMYILDNAFASCMNLKSVTISDETMCFGNNAFASSVETVYCPCDSNADMVEVSMEQFGTFTYIQIEHQYVNGVCSVCGDEKVDNEFVIDENGVLIGYNGKGGRVVIPDGVTAIADSVFESNDYISSVVIPDGVTTIGKSAFKDCQWLFKVKIPDSLNEIGESAFENCCFIYTLTIPDSVTTIGDAAFKYCAYIESIKISNGITSIGDSVFQGCSNLTSITIPDGVTTIGKSAFEYCEHLTNVTIPDGVTTIGDAAFKECLNFETITFPDSVTTIGDSVLEGCYNLVSVTLPNGITGISNSMFAGCYDLEDLTIPDSVTTIGDNAFYYCIGFTSFTVPDGVTTIGNDAFRNSYNIKNIIIPDSVTTIGESAFRDCADLESITLSDSITSIATDTFTSCYKLASVTIPESVTSIDNYAFYNCSALTSITIPESVTTIDDYAFYLCHGLKDVTISDNVKNVGEYIFSSCNDLETVYYPCSSEADAVKAIMESAESNPNFVQLDHNYVGNVCTICGDINISDFIIDENGVLIGYTGNGGDVVIPDGVTGINDCAFSEREDITSVTIPDSVKSIDAGAFEDCTNLISVTLPNGLKAIENETFMNCINLENVTIPDSVESIGASAFENCTGLKNVIIPNSVKSIGVCAFNYCKGIESITISDNVTEIKAHAFWYCENLEDVYVFCDSNINAVKKLMQSFGDYTYIQLDHEFTDNKCRVCGIMEFDIIDGVLYGYYGKGGDVVIPDGVTGIKGAFSNCSSITSVTIPKTVTNIGAKSFENCESLTSVVIPCSVKSIGDYAFENCVSLSSITISGNIVTGEDVFNNCGSLVNVYCTCDSNIASVKAFMEPFGTFTYIKLDHNIVDGVCTACGEKDAAAELAEAKADAIAAIDAATTEYNAEYAEASKYMINTCETVETVNHQKELLLEEMAYIDAIERAKAEIDKFVKENVPSATQELNQFKTAVYNIKKEIITADNKKEADEALANGLKALDEFVPEKYSVTATNGATVTKSLNLNKSTKYEIATVKIAEADGIRGGKWFVYWKDQDGNIVSSYSTYSFYVVEDRTLTPVYVSPDVYEAERAKAILVTDIVRADDNGDGTATLFAEHSASKAAVGDAILQHGVIYTTDAAQKDNLTVDNDSVNKTVAAKTNTSLSGLLKAVIDVEENDTVYAKSYMTNANGNTVYGSAQTLSIGKFTTSADSDFEVLDFDNALEQAEEIIVTADEAPVVTETETETAPSFMSVLMSILNAVMALVQAIIALF
ncbi:MAG: leucine-rich repeat domain-containing protein [Clostridia bacterium]|nr:leucine-rich repeat domain-containing protein [Clostridia bacterium]